MNGRDHTVLQFVCFRLQKMYVILTPAKIVEHVFQPTHLMTANARWDGRGQTVKVSGTFYDNGPNQSSKTMCMTLNN